MMWWSFQSLAVGTAIPRGAIEAQDPPASAMRSAAPSAMTARPAADQAFVSLSHKVTLKLRDVPLGTALEAVNTQAELQLNYSYTIVPVTKRVSIDVTDVSARDVLEMLLDGTNLITAVTPTGDITIVRRAKAEPVQAGGTINGHVTDAATGRPVAGISVMVDGRKTSVLTNDDGSYTIHNVQPGVVSVSVHALGYVPQHRQVTVGATGTVEVNFVLTVVPTHLTDVVTTASGDRRRLEVGNTIASINADSVVQNTLVTNLSDLLESRAPGLVVSPSSGVVGAPSRLRIRGIGSINETNDPIIIMDGVRLTSEYGAGRDPNKQEVNDRPSRIDDIDPNIIESIDVLKGPAASALYGSDAAGGVIVIKTKRGRPGPARWRIYGDQNTSFYPKADYPSAVQSVGHGLQGGGNAYFCSLQEQAIGVCAVVDSTKVVNVLENPAMTPFAHGSLSDLGADVSGGSASLQYFFSGGYNGAVGTTKMPLLNQEIISNAHGGAPVPDYEVRPNAQTNAHFDGKFSAQLGTTADVAFSTSLIRLYNRHGDDGLQGAFNGIEDPTDTVDLIRGWQTFFAQRDENVNRNTNAVTGNWRPTGWLTGHAAYGMDYAVDNDRELVRRNACLPSCGYTQGYPDTLGSINFGQRTTLVQTLDAGTNINWAATAALAFQTALGLNYVRTTTRQLNGTAVNLPAGRTTVDGAGGPFTVDDISDDRAIAGIYLEEQLGYQDRLFLTAGFRKDAGSAIGANVAPVYPKLSASWLASKESYFPFKDVFSQFRLRAAYGHSGVQPGSIDRLQTFSTQSSRFINPDGTLSNIVSLSRIGNTNLRPERSVESEAGFDLDALSERVHFEYTLYRKVTQDALVNHPLAPSLGSSNAISTSRLENIGTVRNTGTEMTLSGHVIDESSLDWTIGLTYASTANKLVTLGPNVKPFSADQFTRAGYVESRVVPGYPLFGRWARPIVAIYDVNGDGIIQMNEIRVGDSLQFMGPSEPKYTMSMDHNIALFNHRVRVAASFEFVGDFMQVNTFQAQVDNNSAVAFLKGGTTASEQRQAYALEGYYGSTMYGYFQNTNTLRFRSLSVQFDLPASVRRMFRSERADITFLARNLALWTNYLGADPSVNSLPAEGNTVSDDGTLIEPRSFGIRLSFNY
jgi:TonB-linked SusC/RagA family outer membrane protein